MAVFNFAEAWYNPHRRHPTRGLLSSLSYRRTPRRGSLSLEPEPVYPAGPTPSLHIVARGSSV
jgi:hypothetical protein